MTSATVPTSAELAGDFSQGKDASSIIYDPLTGLPFSGNKLPADRINAAAQKIVSLETPAETRVAQSPQILNFFATAPIEGYQPQYDARIDVNATPKDSIFARYTFWNPHNGPSDPFGTDTGAGRTGNYTQEGVFGENHVFSPTTIADLRLSYLENYNFQYPLSEGFDMSSINSSYGAIQAQSQNAEGLLPGLGIQNYGVGAELSQLYWNNTVYALSGSVTKIWGRHAVKFGAAGRQVLWTNYGNSQGTSVSSLASYTAASNSPAVTAAGLPAGNGLASFLLNTPSSAGITEVGTWRAFLHPYDFYATDTFQVNNKLTVNAGIRWEQPGAYSEVNNLDTILQPNTAVNVGGLTAITNPVTGANMPLTGQLAFVNSPEYPSRREEQLHWLLFSPRVGFAYRLNDSTVVRSGYGISYFPAEITADSPSNSPINSAGTNISNIAPTAATATTPFVPATLNTTVADPFPTSSFPTGIHEPLGRNPIALTQQLGQSISSRIPEQSYGYAQQTMNRYRATISMIFQEAIRNGKAETNPARLVRLHREANSRLRFITYEEEEEIRAIIRKRCAVHEPEFTLALETGMRRGELYGLEWDRVHLERRQPILLETKNGTARVVILTTRAAEALEELKSVAQKKRIRSASHVMVSR